MPPTGLGRFGNHVSIKRPLLTELGVWIFLIDVPRHFILIPAFLDFLPTEFYSGAAF
jgi:hypothetical protein